jgi:hypothetical protein
LIQGLTLKLNYRQNGYLNKHNAIVTAPTKKQAFQLKTERLINYGAGGAPGGGGGAMCLGAQPVLSAATNTVSSIKLKIFLFMVMLFIDIIAGGGYLF